MKREGATQELQACCRSLISRGVIAFLICGFGGQTLEATEYYVAVDSPNASDSNNGLSLDQPFKTLNRGVQALSPGDTLSIKEGIYREAVSVRSGTVEQSDRDPGLPG